MNEVDFLRAPVSGRVMPLRAGRRFEEVSDRNSRILDQNLTKCHQFDEIYVLLRVSRRNLLDNLRVESVERLEEV
jgi:hypothetical protein